MPERPTSDAWDRLEDSLDTLIPANANQPYDMHEVIAKTLDEGEFFEIQPKHAANIICGFGRIEGKTVGVVANNPSMAALTQALDTRGSEPPPELAEICLLSLGTGTNLSFIQGRTLDWGLGQWAKPLINLLMDASTGIADYQCRQILRGAYRRIAPVFPAKTNIKLDDWKRADELLAFGQATPLVDTWDDTDVVPWLTESGW